jgi:hypothetical protein
MSNGTHLASRKAGPLRPMIDLTCSCPWSTLAHAPSASSSGRVPVNAPLRRPRNRWEALRNRLDHAGWAGWAAPVLAGCHRPSPAGSPLHPILAGRVTTGRESAPAQSVAPGLSRRVHAANRDNLITPLST